ncbi:MAG: hypothetical protein IKH58_04675 [Bacteroidales bacterium]|nr:hypothetical protein [Bacteroidales bacterium]
MDIIKCEDESLIQFVKRKAYFARIIQPRLNFSINFLNTLINSGKVKPIDISMLNDIKSFWRSFLGDNIQLIDFRWYDVYNSIEDDKDLVKYYMPCDFYYAFIDEYYSNPQHSAPCDDKNFYDLYFPEAKLPKTLFRKVGKSFLNDKYEIISKEEVLGICKAYDKIILKKSRFSGGGLGVTFIDTNISDNELIKALSSINSSFICQDIVRQHPELNKLNDTSLNTIRIQTLVRNNKVNVLSPLIRVGNKGSKTDNLTGGGMVCGINADGSLKNRVFDHNLQKYELSPQGYKFSDIKIPSFERCTELVSKLAVRFSDISRLMSWDLAIDEDADPVLIETNLTFSGVDVHQLANGPIYGNHPEPIIEEVVNNSYTLRKLLRL